MLPLADRMPMGTCIAKFQFSWCVHRTPGAALCLSAKMGVKSAPTMWVLALLLLCLHCSTVQSQSQGCKCMHYITTIGFSIGAAHTYSNCACQYIITLKLRS